jgi:hypothetical protein
VATQHYKPPRPGLFKLHATLLCVKLDHDTWRMVPLPPPSPASRMHPPVIAVWWWLR